ncbi:uncharacterized protein BO97DRAFT_428065 [Aspergillus homomorphus CBS 101889]|uniref:Uncharacterized protein n=1 Tax=Aspergillus homomorphus (strain CBS 101889) TaxID=1450537 RepID=A0A395HLE4_ASPHC|nr:hypothetical protein BO97DRAFT_428065 [Aspergillus homomorphus CBS 101889]RAL08751.1 hypothetical protein BO97DRAFT_428065 [Aspergillus homomorphus CBS 101889]
MPPSHLLFPDARIRDQTSSSSHRDFDSTECAIFEKSFISKLADGAKKIKDIFTSKSKEPQGIPLERWNSTVKLIEELAERLVTKDGWKTIQFSELTITSRSGGQGSTLFFVPSSGKGCPLGPSGHEGAVGVRDHHDEQVPSERIAVRGVSNYTIWYHDQADPAGQLIVVEAKRAETLSAGLPQVLGYMGVTQIARGYEGKSLGV